MVQKGILPCSLNLMVAKILFGWAGFHTIGYFQWPKRLQQTAGLHWPTSTEIVLLEI